MDFFIYGSRQSGKSSKIVEILDILPPALPVVWNINPSVGRYLGINRRFYRDRRGLGNFIKVYDDIETNASTVRWDFDGIHNIVTATPDNNNKNINTRAYELFEYTRKKGWAVIQLPPPDHIISEKDHLPSDLHLGQVYGKWYTHWMKEKEDAANRSNRDSGSGSDQ